MRTAGKETIGSSTLPSSMSMIERTARLLVDDQRTVRKNYRNGLDTKFPTVELTIITPDFDREQGTGSRVSYTGVIDRATRDAMGRDPTVLFESGHETAEVPVMPGLPMIVDGARLAEMPKGHQELAVKLAGHILASLTVVPQVQ